MAVHRPVRFHVGHRRQRAVLKIGEEVGHVAHVIGDHVGIGRFVFERVADVAVAAAQRVARAVGIEAAAVVLPRDVVLAEHVADASLRRRRNDEPGPRLAFRREGRIDVDGLPVRAVVAFRVDVIRQRIQVVRDRGNAGLRHVGTVEPLRAVRVEIERTGRRIRVVDVGCRGRCRMPVAVAVEDLIGEPEWLAVGSRAAEDRLVVVVAHRVVVGERLEQRRVAVLHVEVRHRLPGVVRCAAGRRAVGRRDGGLQIVQAARGVVGRHVLAIDRAIDLLDHLEVLMDRVGRKGVVRHRRPCHLERSRRQASSRC